MKQRLFAIILLALVACVGEGPCRLEPWTYETWTVPAPDAAADVDGAADLPCDTLCHPPPDGEPFAGCVYGPAQKQPGRLEVDCHSWVSFCPM